MFLERIMPKFTQAGSKWTGVQYYDSTTKRHNGRADRCFYIRFRNAQNKMIREKIGWASEGYTPQMAAHLRCERMRVIRHGDELPKKKASPLTYRQLAQMYFEGPGANIKGLKNDINRWQTHLAKTYGDRTPESLSPIDIDGLKKFLEANGKSPATIWNVLELLRRITNFGADSRISPALTFKLKMPKRNNEKTEILTPDEWKRLAEALAAYPDQSVANIIKLAAFGGLRKSEIFNLKWDDVDFRNRIIHIKNPKSGEPEQIPMNDLLVEILKSHPQGDSEYVFPGKQGKKRTEARVADKIKEIAMLPVDFRPWHGLRHAFASALAESGKVDMYHIQKLLRHRSPQMTQRYAHLSNQTLLKASNVISNNINKKHS